MIPRPSYQQTQMKKLAGPGKRYVAIAMTNMVSCTSKSIDYAPRQMSFTLFGTY